MRRHMHLILGISLMSACAGIVFAQGKLNPDDLAGKWSASFLGGDPATFELEPFDKDSGWGKFKSQGSLGRPFGGPNPLNATKWRVKGDELQFFHISARGQEQDILSGRIRFEKNNEKLTFKITSGYWATTSRLKDKTIIFQK